MSTDGLKLLSCPFCGGAAIFGNDGDGAEGVGCEGCGAGTRAFYPLMGDVKHLAAEAWNQRSDAALAEMTAERDAALREAAELRKDAPERRRIASILAAHNCWRRGETEDSPCTPKELGAAIDRAVDLLRGPNTTSTPEAA